MGRPPIKNGREIDVFEYVNFPSGWQINPSADAIIQVGDVLVAVGSKSQLDSLTKFMDAPSR